MRGRLKLQEWIHGLELGAGAAYVRGLLALGRLCHGGPALRFILLSQLH